MKIHVRNINHGLLYAEPITVVTREDDTIVWCNHAGAEEESQQVDFWVGDRDRSYYQDILICDKCNAYKFKGEEYWEDSPAKGVHYE